MPALCTGRGAVVDATPRPAGVKRRGRGADARGMGHAGRRHRGGGRVVPAARRTAFTLIEVVIVLIILGIIAAIAVPRLSRGTEGTAEAALKQDLAVMQHAIDHYAGEHGGQYPDAARVVEQLTGYTDAAGNVAPAKSRAAPYVFGPYLREVPAAPLGPNRGTRAVTNPASPDAAAAWVYDPAGGTIGLNAPPKTARAIVSRTAGDAPQPDTGN